MDFFFEEVPLYSKKIQAYALAVQNAIVIDVKVDKDLFLCFKFYGDQTSCVNVLENNQIVGLYVIFII